MCRENSGWGDALISLKTTIHCAAVVLLAALAIPLDCHAFRYVKAGDRPASFDLSSLDGQRFSLAENLGPKATVLFFWAAWNPRSHEALVDYQRLFSEHAKDGLQVVGVNVEHEELSGSDRALIGDSVRRSNAAFPVLLDEGLHVFSEYGVSAVPSTVLLDSSGVAVEVLPGYAPHLRTEFRDRVLQALGIYVEPAEPVIQDEGYKPKGKAARYFMMAKLLLKKGMKTEGMNALRTALKEDPDYEEAEMLLRELERR